MTGFEIGLVVGPIVQFDCSARYHLVSSERERKEGNSDASKKGRIMYLRGPRASKMMYAKQNRK